MSHQTQEVNCKACDVKFQKDKSQIKKHPNHFCSRSCAAKFNNKGKIKNPKKERICRICTIAFFTKSNGHRNTRTCEKCAIPYKNEEVAKFTKSLTIGEYKNKLSVKGKHPSWAMAHIRQFNRYWNAEMRTMGCKNCGYAKHVELAHIKSVSSYPDSATLGEINAKSNVIPLCPNCHWEFDNGLLIL